MVNPDDQDFRLPTTVAPEHYDLRLNPDLPDRSFKGEEVITISVRERVTEVVLNAADLEIGAVSISRPGGASVGASCTLDQPNERAIFSFVQTLEPGAYQLRIEFSGKLNEKLAGFYRSTYVDADGTERTLAATQFEATDARRAFPCWDEPALKAVFSLTLTVDVGLTAISNGPVLSETRGPESGKKTVVFAETMRMSTYLVAFIVGEFESSDAIDVGGVPLRVWSVPGKGRLTGFAGSVGAASLEFFGKYYGIPYPAAKLDLIAIPDFAAGAMENLGAVTFRETALLLDDGAATHAERERVAIVVAHELAHMWFGDLVTMRWWNGLWLNEAFATFMEMLAIDAWKPEWETWLNFGSSRAAALLIDGLRSSRPIEFTVRRPEEASAMFDVLTYEKGAAVLRMLEQYLGPQLFREGIGMYLRRHAYGNAETHDLWDSLEAASDQPIRRMMDSWVFQAGYPLITVDADVDGSVVRLSQRRFLYLGDDGEEQANVWSVPVMCRTTTLDETLETKTLLEGQDGTVMLGRKPEWLIANAGGHGFYRVRYAPELLRRLMPHIQSGLSPIERLNLVNDAWAATLAGYTSLVEFLDLTQRFQEERDESVWTNLIAALGTLRRTMGDAEQATIASIARDRLGAIYHELGWVSRDGESDRMRQLRGEVLGARAIVGEDSDVERAAREYYEAYRANPATVDPNTVPALISILAHSGDTARYEEFWRAFKAAKTPQETERYLFALAGFRQQELLTRTLESALNGEVRTQDAPYLVRAVMSNPAGKELAWSYVKEHWQAMLERYPENAIVRLCEGVTVLTAPEQEKDVLEFFAKHEVKQAGQRLDQTLERLRMSVRFRQRESANLLAYGRGFAATS